MIKGVRPTLMFMDEAAQECIIPTKGAHRSRYMDSLLYAYPELAEAGSWTAVKAPEIDAESLGAVILEAIRKAYADGRVGRLRGLDQTGHCEWGRSRFPKGQKPHTHLA